MNICVFGNSHTGAIKRAWDLISEAYSDINLTFYAARGTGLRSLAIENKSIISLDSEVAASIAFTSGKDDQVCLSDYDAVVVYASGLKAHNPRTFYSEQLTQIALQERFAKTMSSHICTLIRELSDMPIFLAHTPLRPADDDTQASSQEIIDYCHHQGLANILFYQSFNAEVIPQPEETLGANGLTQSSYAKGSKKLAVGSSVDNQLHGDRDNTHMNDAFGRLWLEALFNRLNTIER